MKKNKIYAMIPARAGSTRLKMKNLALINGKPMIQVITENLNIDARHIFVVQSDHYEKYNLKQSDHLSNKTLYEIVSWLGSLDLSQISLPRSRKGVQFRGRFKSSLSSILSKCHNFSLAYETHY